MVELIVLGSGSRGNCTLVRSGGGAVLIDAGLSARQIVRRLLEFGQSPDHLDGILLTHEHSDHVNGIAVFTRRHDVPVLGNAATLNAAGPALGQARRETFQTGQPFDWGGFLVTPFATPHDAAEPVGFVLEAHGRRVGYATDLGHVTQLVSARLAGCAAIVFESNHDREMLMEGPYPWVTKQRVSSRLGHLSNDHAASALPALVGPETRHLVLAHLSQTNNHPELAKAAVETALNEAGLKSIMVSTAAQERPAELVRL